MRNEVQLRDLVGNLATTAGALAAEQAALRATVRELAPALAQASGALDALDAAFPADARLGARDPARHPRDRRGDRRGAPVGARGARAAAARTSCAACPRELAPLGRDLATLTDESLALLPLADRTARCARDVVLPTGEQVIRDEFTTGEENYKELFYGLVGLTGEGQNFDGNGQYVRFQTGGGDNVIRLGQSSLGGPPQFGALPVPSLGTRPRLPGPPAAVPPGRPVRRPGGRPRSTAPRPRAGRPRERRREGRPRAPRRRPGHRRAGRRRSRRGAP